MNKTICLLAIALSACATSTTTSTDRSQFNVMKNGVNMDEMALKCVDDPKSLGFATSQECFAQAQKMMAS